MQLHKQICAFDFCICTEDTSHEVAPILLNRCLTIPEVRFDLINCNTFPRYSEALANSVEQNAMPQNTLFGQDPTCLTLIQNF